MRNELEIAIIGISVRFPGSRNYREFWHNLKNGVESIEFYSEEELREAGVQAERINASTFVPAKGGRVKSKDLFDYHFFGYTPHEAGVMNPQTRMLHETAWEALEDAGYNPLEYEKLIGLFAGASSSFYWEGINTLAQGDKELDDFSESQFMDKDYSCSKVSYALNLKGPVFHLQTACSTSLVAVHLACQSLLNGECDMALAGGVSLKSHEEYGYMYQEGMILSPDGHCRPFDKDAAGFIGGEGAGIVVLKLMDDAIRDNDNIYAIIKGSAINNDGRRKDSYTSPSISGQREVINYAYQLAGIEPDSISLVETHGTATNLGDQIEIEALKSAFHTSNTSSKRNYCALGSVKANIGHLDTAAGIAGLVKAVLALKHKEIPPLINFKEYNPRLKLEDSPFYINTETIPWEAQEGPRRAGVSSFGIGGTNVHVLLEEYVAPSGKKSEDTDELLVLSARSQEGLKKSIDNLRDFTLSNKDISLSDLAHTLQVGRKDFEHRCMFLASSLEMVSSILANPTSGKIKFSHVTTNRHTIIFMFAGLGSQYLNMGRQLYSRIPFFRKTVDSCFTILQEEVEARIPHFYNSPEPANKEEIHEFAHSQYIVFIVEYALATLLIHWGIRPVGVIGYSLGEYTAACIAGVMTVRETLEILRTRGELVAKIEDSVLLSIPLPREKTEKYLGPDISLAIDNGESCILAGRVDVMTELEQRLKKERILSIRIANSRAVHSHLVLPIVDDFKKSLGAIHWQKPQFPILSNVRGEWLSGLEISCPTYWAEHLSKTVLFHQSMELLSHLDEPVLLEIGPGRDLANLVSRYVGKKGIVLNTIKSEGEEEEDYPFLLKRVGLLWNNGIEWKWGNIYNSQNRHRISLPTYPFKEQLLENALTGKESLGVLRELGQMKASGDQDEEMYTIGWKSSLPSLFDSPEEKAETSILVFTSSHPVCASFLELLTGEGAGKVTRVTYHDAFEICAENSYLLDPEKYMHYRNLFLALAKKKEIPQQIIYFWSMEIPVMNADADALVRFKAAQATGLFGLILLAQAIKEVGIISDIEITIVTNNLHSVIGEETVSVESSTIIGPLKVFSQEMGSLKTRNVDFSISLDGEKRIHERAARQLYQTIQHPPVDKIVAFRGDKCWIEDFDVIENTGKTSLLKTNGVYLITGGMGEIGLQLAEAIGRDYQAKLILMGRHSIDARRKEDPRLKTIQRLQATGAEVFYLQGDVGNYKQLEEVFRAGESKFGKIDGIIHCAGIVNEQSFKTVLESSKADFEEHFQAKVYGVIHLEKLLKSREPDFCLVMSSVSTILGGLGFCAYVSANAFMDYKILSTPSDTATRWISVDWDKLSPAKTVTTIYKILTTRNLNRIVVSNVGELKKRMTRWINLHELEETAPVIMDESNDIRNRLSTEYQAPQGETEKQLATIWQRFFGITAISSKDSFFELGGDSLKALSLLNLIRKTLKKEVTLRDLMNNSSIEKLALLIDQKSGDYRETTVLKPDPDNLDKPFPLTDVQFAYWIGRSDIMELGNIAAHGYQENDLVDFDYQRFSLAFNTMIKRHGVMRMVVLESGEQKINTTTPVYTIPVVDLRKKNTGEIIAKIKEIRNEMSHYVFDCTTWPLFEIRATRITERLTRIHFSFDGLILDGPSTRILYNELYRLYKNPREELQPLILTFRDYVLAIEEQRNSAPFLEKKFYWEKRIPDFPPAPDLPTLQRTAATERPTFKRYTHILSKDSWDKLKQLCRDKRITQNTLLLAAYNEVLLAWSRNKRYVLNLTFFQRDPGIHPQVNEIIGDFTSLILLEIDNTQIRTLGERIESIHEQLWKDIDNSAYSGIRVIRDITRLKKSQGAARYPVVFTSLLSVEEMELEQKQPESIETIQTELTELQTFQGDHTEELEIFEISQTPQVILDHQVTESGGDLHIVWDVLEGIFLPDMIKDMFQVFCGLLDKIVAEPDLLEKKEPLKGIIQQTTMTAFLEDAQGVGDLLRRLKDAKVLRAEEKRKAWIRDSIGKRLTGVAGFPEDRLLEYEDFYNGKDRAAPQAISFKDFSSLFNYFSPVENDYDNKRKYRYASAGGLYPVDIYLAVNEEGIESLAKGMYFLHTEKHAMFGISKETWAEIPRDLNFSLVLVGSFDKIQALYGEDSYSFMNIEAGIIAQGIKAEASEKGWQLSLLYGLDYEGLEKQLELNGHQIILSVLGISNLREKAWRKETRNISLGIIQEDLMTRLNVIDYNRNQIPLIIDPVQRYNFKQKQARREGLEEDRKVALITRNEYAEKAGKRAFSRRSYRNFTGDKISFADFQNLLKDLTSSAEGEVLSFPYISYCNLHAVKLYFIVKENRIEGIEPGVYRFETVGGQWSLLSKMYSTSRVRELYDNEVNSPIFEGASFGIYFTIELKECLPLYGDRAMEYAYFEAGALCHSLETHGPARRIGFCQIGGLDGSYLLELFQADEDELYLHSILGGNIAAVQAHKDENSANLAYFDNSRVMKKMKSTATLLHTPFLEQARKNGAAIALTSGDKKITYKELDSMSEVLAEELRRKGVVPNSLVAVIMTKGWEQVVSVLGILKAGAAYLPVDAELPRERIDYLLEVGDVSVILTQEEYADEGRDTIVIDEEFLAGDTAEKQIEALPLVGDDLAYVIFTSGSTGKPKGVMISHSGALNTVLTINSLYNVKECDRVIALSSLDFDLSVYDIFGTLAAGGTLVIPDKNVLKDPALLYNLIKQENITIWNSVPAYMKMFITYVKESQQSLHDSLRLVLLSGDWISIPMLREIRAINKDIELISLGGATEASIWSIYYPINEIDPQWRSIPYGKALDNQTVYVLDSNLNKATILNQGEICIGGVGLAKGYWKDLEKTRSHFFVHPETGERLYRTGDIGQYLPDGNIEIIGRLDFQVKIQGFRIELGEIEINLQSHDDVQDAIVMPHGERDGEKKLVAYVIPRPGTPHSVSELKEYLASRLPHYMVPGMFFFMDAFPLTANGKINRGGLPKPSPIVESETSYTNPSTEAQKKLLEIWKSKLNIEKVGITNNFFEMGGDSLMLLEIHREIKKQFNREFPVLALFRFPTIESLTENLDFDSDTTEQKSTDNKNQDTGKARAEFRKNRTRNRTKED